APTTSAAVDFMTRQLGWKAEGRYHALSGEVGRNWVYGPGEQIEAVSDLRKVIALDSDMQVLVAHGFTDTQTPYFASELILDQIPVMGDPDRVRLTVYPGGHMYYSRDDSRRAFLADVKKVYGVR
ncbi:MAG: peptidase S10, partial [Asticcacaulis sp.]